MDFLQPIVNEDISLFSYFPYGAFSLLTCHIWNEMSLQIRFYFPTNYIKVEFFYRFFPTHLESIYLFYFFNLLFYLFFFLIIFFPSLITGLVTFFKMANRFPSFGCSFAWICARISSYLKPNIWLPCSYLIEEKQAVLREKFPVPNYGKLIQKQAVTRGKPSKGECENHFLDSFVTQAEIEGFVVALDENLQGTYGRLLQLSGVVFPPMKPRKIPYMLVTVSVLACIEVRLSLLEHHFFHQVIMNAVTQLKSYDLTQALLSGSHF